MNTFSAGLIVAAIAYLAGSLPFGYLTARFVAGIDIRAQGSGNIGATNVARVLGSKYGIFVLFLDALKGLLPVWLLPLLFGQLATGAAAAAWTTHIQILCGVLTIVGHMFPCWLKFKGGKGVATAMGVIIMISWQASLVALGTFVLIFAITRIVSLSSMLASAAFAGAQMWLLQPDPFSETDWSSTAFSLAIPLLIIFRHRTNLVRLLKGEEPKFKSGKGKSEG